MNERQNSATLTPATNDPLIPELLTRLGLCPSYKGYHCLEYVIYLAASDGEYPFIVTKKLYTETAAHFGISPGCVQHGIRTLLDIFWSQENSKKLFRDITHYPVLDPLSPKEFIAVMADFIRRNR